MLQQYGIKDWVMFVVLEFFHYQTFENCNSDLLFNQEVYSKIFDE